MNIRSIRIPGQVMVLLTIFGYLLLLMALWRTYFVFSITEDLDPGHILLYLQAYWVALRLDAVIAGYGVLPVFLTIYLPIVGWHHKWYRSGLTMYLVFFTILVSFLNLVDVSFFDEFGTHINILAVQRNAVQADTLQFIISEYPVLLYLITLGLAGWGSSILFRRLLRIFEPRPGHWGIQISTGFLALVLLVLALRGGWQERPIDWGHAMFSQHAPANQIALNGVFLLSRSIIEFSSEKNLSEDLDRQDAEQALQLVRQMIQGPGEEFIDGQSIARTFADDVHPITPHIVLVVLESHVGEFCGYINPAMQSVTPRMDVLASEGLAYTQCYANGKRSAFGISSLLCSWPVLPGFPIISQVEATRNIETAGTLLQKIGYDTCFLYGGDADFDNMKGFLVANGFNRVIEEKDFTGSLPGNSWGVFDHFVFDKALSLLDNSPDPLFLTLFTTTNHQPFTIPAAYEDRLPEFDQSDYKGGKPLRTMSYTDMALGEFMDEARTRSWFDDAIFVFISDHGLTVHREMYEDPRNAHIPFIIYAPKIIPEPRRIPTVVSQIDVLPTLLSIIHYPDPFSLMGKNVQTPAAGFALRVVNDHVNWFEESTLLVEDLGQSSTIYGVESIADQPYRILSDKAIIDPIRTRYQSYIQTAYHLFKQMHSPEGLN